MHALRILHVKYKRPDPEMVGDTQPPRLKPHPSIGLHVDLELVYT